MKQLFFTFDNQYPLTRSANLQQTCPYEKDEYVVVWGHSERTIWKHAMRQFPYSNITGHSMKEWLNIRDNYRREPSKEIVTPGSYGSHPDDFSSLYIHVPAAKSLVQIKEGGIPSPGQQEIGMKSFIGITVWDMQNHGIAAARTMRLHQRFELRDRYFTLADAIPDVMLFLYNNPALSATILK